MNPDGPRLRPKRRPPFPAALARFSGGSSSFVWVRNPAGIQLASPLLGLPLRPRQAESGGGGGGGGLSPHRLISALPTGNAALPGPPESPPEGPGDRPGARVGRESHTGAHTVGHHHRRRPFSSRAQRPRAAAKLRVPASAARPALSAPRSLSSVAGAAPHRACAPRSWQRGWPGAEASSREYASPGRLLGARSRQTPQLTDCVLHTLFLLSIFPRQS